MGSELKGYSLCSLYYTRVVFRRPSYQSMCCQSVSGQVNEILWWFTMQEGICTVSWKILVKQVNEYFILWLMYLSFYLGTVGVCMRQERVKWQYRWKILSQAGEYFKCTIISVQLECAVWSCHLNIDWGPLLLNG